MNVQDRKNRQEVKKKLKERTEATYGTFTFEQYYGKEQADHIRQTVENLLQNKKGGFIVMLNGETGRISDAYMAICAHDVIDVMIKMVTDAEKLGLLEKCTCKETKNG